MCTDLANTAQGTSGPLARQNLFIMPGDIQLISNGLLATFY